MSDGLSAKATRSPSATDGVSVSIEVDVTPDVAFDVFTQEMDAWWARGPRFRFLAPYAGTMTLEPRIGGRLLHVADAGRVFVVGEVHVWEPPRRVALTWRLPNFSPEQVTHVDVRFDPVSDGTRVTVVHSGWDRLPPDHQARHGLTGREFVMLRGEWWRDMIGAVKRHAEARGSNDRAEGGQR